jgi:hypothetical protein
VSQILGSDAFPRLTAAGWTVTPFDPSMLTAIPVEKAVEEWPTEIGPADSRDVVFVLAACGDGDDCS